MEHVTQDGNNKISLEERSLEHYGQRGPSKYQIMPINRQKRIHYNEYNQQDFQPYETYINRNKSLQYIGYKPQQPGPFKMPIPQSDNCGQNENPFNGKQDYGYRRDDISEGRNSRNSNTTQG